ncbi:hypothetical protein LTR08_002696 [Meristemomyces frigidus]|nr:hypothetical protein LTR08_002696 [Meristemomyces frigidus]
MSTPPDMQSAARHFFASSTFAVAGASSVPSKFGYICFRWFQDHNLATVPLNPTTSSITVAQKTYSTVPTNSKLKDPKSTGLNIITPPFVTAQLLREAKAAGVRAVWLQPGSFGDEELEFAIREFPGAAVGGFAKGTRGGEGWCVLVDGETYMSGRDKKL